MIRLHVPMPLQIVLDDVGWWSGLDDSKRGGPFRTGIPRDHVPSDYAAIVELGRRLRMKPQAAMILAEWDTDNILREVPSATWMGKAWDNRRWNGARIEHAGDILRSGAEHYEIALHGLAHEFWHEDGQATRAEFADMEGRMRPPEEVEAHLDYYARLLAQHRLGGFPISYAPPAGRHGFGSGPGGFEERLARRGVRYLSTPFSVMTFHRPTEHPALGLGSGVLTVDRGPDLCPWFAINAQPPEAGAPGPIAGLHWPNILHLDPRKNLDVVDRWVAFFRGIDRLPGRMLSRDTGSCFTQFAYHHAAKLKARGQGASLDCAPVDRLSPSALGDTFVIKVEGPDDLAIDVRGAQVVERGRDAGGHHLLRIRRVEGERLIQIDWRTGDEA